MSIDTCIGVCSYSGELNKTKELVEFITQPDVMWEYCDSQSSYSPLTDDRIPSDKTIAPSAPYLSNGRSILRNDYDLTLPVESSLREVGNQLMQGMSVDDALQLLDTLLYSKTEA